MDSKRNINFYKRFRVWLNKKTSLLLVKRSKNKEYLAVESGLMGIFLDGLMLSGSISYLFSPSIYTLILSLGCGSFILKKVFPYILQLLNSINLVRIKA